MKIKHFMMMTMAAVALERQMKVLRHLFLLKPQMYQLM